MSNYIWLDNDGREVKREPKGRGRPRIDAVQKEDGNWYISASTSQRRVEPITVKSTVTRMEVEQPEFNDSGRGSKVINNPTPVTLDSLLPALFRSPKDECRDNGEIDLRRVVVHKETNVVGISFNAVYARVLIKKDGTVHLWSIAHGEPSYIINNATRIPTVAPLVNKPSKVSV